MRIEQVLLRLKLKLGMLVARSRDVLKLGWLVSRGPLKWLMASGRCRGSCLCRRRLAAARTLLVDLGSGKLSLTPLTLSRVLVLVLNRPAMAVPRWVRLLGSSLRRYLILMFRLLLCVAITMLGMWVGLAVWVRLVILAQSLLDMVLRAVLSMLLALTPAMANPGKSLMLVWCSIMCRLLT